MSKQKKITYNELMERNNFLFEKILQIQKAVDYSHTVLLKYIDFKEDAKGLKKYLEKEIKKNEQANRSSSEADRSNKSGDKSVSGKSNKSGG